jgi:hypothetical protein
VEGIALCGFALVACFMFGRRSLTTGLGVLMGLGYAYGIVRANVPDSLVHFIFDAGVVGFYLSLLSRRMTSEQRRRVQVLMPWLALLVGWPILLFFLPVQDPLVQLVGLRGQIFFLPFLLVGAMLESEDYYVLAKWLAVLNLFAFGFAVAEYFEGLDAFFPRNANTIAMYGSRDLIGYTQYRIPSTFIASASYCGTMVCTIPLLLNAWAQKRAGRLEYWLFMAALGASLLGVFMGASRSWAGIMVLAVGSTFLAGQMTFRVLLASIVLTICVGWIVANNPRLQRFTTLQDTNMVEKRIASSVNESFVDALHDYPMGNGLGGGGTSIPYFLQDRVKDSVTIENEYGRILLETGIPGLLIWLIFIFWTFAHTMPDGEWVLALRLTRNVLAISFATAVIGTGLLTWIPGTPLVLTFMGWITTARTRQPAVSRATQPQLGAVTFATNRRYAVPTSTESD